jgi:hypothetical protein
MGKIGAKYFASNACVNSLTPIEGCKIYYDQLSAAATSTVSGSCVECDKHMPIVETTTASVVNVTCAKTPPTGCT